MSSISGLQSSVTTQTTTTSSVTATATTGTPTSSALYLDIGLGNLTRDLTGLTKPRTPADSGVLLGEILALAEELAASTRDTQLKLAGALRRTSLAEVGQLANSLESLSYQVDDKTKTINSLTKEKNETIRQKETTQNTYDQAVKDFETYDKRVNDTYSQYNSDAGYWKQQISSLEQELKGNISKDRREAITKPGGLLDQYTNNKTTAEWYRDVWTKSNSNPDWVVRNAAAQTRDKAFEDLKTYADKIKDLGDKITTNTNDKNKLEGDFQETSRVVVAVVSAFAIAAAAAAAGRKAANAGVDAFLDDLADSLQALAKKALNVGSGDWTGTMKLRDSDTDNTAPVARMPVIAAVVGLMAALKDVLEAILAISKLDTGRDPGLDETTSGRYHLAI